MGMQQQRLAGFYKMQIDGSFVSYLAGSGHLRRGRDSIDATIFALMHDGTLKNVAPDGRQWFDVQAYNDECGPNGDKMGVYLKGLGWDHTIQDTWQPTKLIFEQVVESDYSEESESESDSEQLRAEQLRDERLREARNAQRLRANRVREAREAEAAEAKRVAAEAAEAKRVAAEAAEAK